jgi:hypothetical protein
VLKNSSLLGRGEMPLEEPEISEIDHPVQVQISEVRVRLGDERLLERP